MNNRLERRIGAVLGVFLLLVLGVAVSLRPAAVFESPVTTIQFGVLGAAGVFDIVAASENSFTDRVAWYRWRGLGDVCLGLAMPLGVLGGVSSVLGWGLALGGLSIGLLGIDALFFHGRHTRGRKCRSDRP